MLYSVRIERLGQHLATLRPIVERCVRGDPDYAEAVGTWLDGTETLLSELRIQEGSEMATLRARIVQAADGQNAAGERVRRHIRRAQQDRAATQALERAEEILRGRVLEAEERLQGFEEKLIESLTAALLLNLVSPPEEPREAWLRSQWGALAHHEATRPTTVFLAASLLAPDRLYLLDRVLGRLFSKELPIVPVLEMADDHSPLEN